MLKKQFALFLASVMLFATACGGEESSEEPSVTEPAATAQTTVPADSSAGQASTELEDPVAAAKGEAYLSIADDRWYLQYWGSSADYLSYNAGVTQVAGYGSYTVSVTIDSNGCRYSTTGDANGEVEANGVAYMGVQIMDGAEIYPNAALTIDSVVVDGTEIPLTASNYTCIEEATVDNISHSNIRANIYNPYATEIPEDAKSVEGPIADLTSADAYSATIIDGAAIGSWTTIEVHFTLSAISQ